MRGLTNIWHVLTSIGLATIGISVAVGALWLLPKPVLSDDLDTASFRAECEVLFLGPSYVHAQIRPGIFDSESRRLGHPLRSCVFGKDSLSGYEEKRMLMQILEQDWPRLKMIFVDISLGATSTIPPENRFKPRLIEWHDLGGVRWTFGRLTRGKLTLKKVGDFGVHVQHAVARALRVGQGAEFLAQKIAKQTSDPKPRPVTETAKVVERKVRKLLRSKAKRPNRGRITWSEELVKTCADKQMECRILLAPIWVGMNVPSSPKKGIIVHDYNDPIHYPELYVPEARGRTAHLSTEGRKTYTRLLARDIVNSLIPHAGPDRAPPDNQQ